MRTIIKQNSESGFSLIELVLVISLVGIMSVYAVPAMLNMGAINLDGASRVVESDIRYAQNLATTTGQTHGFRTLAATGENPIIQYEVYNSVTGAVVSSPYDHLPMSENLEESYNGVEFGSVVDIRFDDIGTPNFVSGSGDVPMATEDGESNKTVTVSSTGLIEIVTP